MKSFYATSFKSLSLVHSNDKFLGRLAQLCKKYASTFTLLFFGLFISSVVMAQATVKTDKSDYKPGDRVIMTGASWMPGEQVSISIKEIPSDDQPMHYSATAGGDGKILMDQFLTQQSHLGKAFFVTAIGASSADTAFCNFTDAIFTSVTSGSWNSPATWGLTGAPVEGLNYPGSNDNVTITNHNSITLSVNASCKTLNISAPNTGNGNSSLDMGGFNLTVNDAGADGWVNLISSQNSRTVGLITGLGTLSLKKLELTTGSSGNAGFATFTLSNNGTLNVSDLISSSGMGNTFTIGNPSTVNYNGAGNQNIFNGFGYRNLTLSNGGVKTALAAFTALGTTTVNSGVTFAQGNGTFTNMGTANVNGTFQINQGGFATGTWNYAATGSTLIYNNSSGTYGPINSHTYWPTLNPPFNVTCLNNSNGTVDLGSISRTVNGTFTLAKTISNWCSLVLNGSVVLNSGYNFSGNCGSAAVFACNSTLQYNTGGTITRGQEWTSSMTPGNVQLSNNTTMNFPTFGNGTICGNLTIDAGSSLYQDFSNGSAALTVGKNIAINGNLSLGFASGNITVGGNWNRASSGSAFNTNGRAVIFNGGADQTITRTGGETFSYLVVNKSAGNLIPASSVSASAASGDVLQIINAGGIDLNNQTLTLSGAGGNILVGGSAAGTRTITGTGTFAISGGKTVTNNNSKSLLLNTNVTTKLSAAVGFGASLTTINGVLEINSGGSVTSGGAPFYATGSTLRYNSGSNYGAFQEWYPNTFGDATGVPFNVDIASGSSLNFGSTNTAREARGNITISSTSGFALSNVAGGHFKLKGNWINNGGTFTSNGNRVYFNGTGIQSITKSGGEVLATTYIEKTSGGSVDLPNNLQVDNLVFETGNTANINTYANTLFVFGNAAGDVVRNGGGYVNGKLQRSLGSTNQDYFFPVGKTTYRPLTINATSGTGVLSSEAFETSIVGTVPANTTLFPNRQWNVTQVSGGPFTYNITLDGTDFAPGTSDAVILKDGTNPLSSFSATASGSNYTASGISGFSNFALAASCDPPVITNQPQSQVKCEGQSVSLVVTATGSGVPSYTYQWYKETGATDMTLVNGSGISGATTATLTINPVAVLNAGDYYVIVSRPCGSTSTSANATLTVNEKPQIITQPLAQNITYGDNASFTSAATGEAPLTYQWQEQVGGGTFINISNNTLYSGAISATLTITKPSVSLSTNKYRCVVTNSCGNGTSDGMATLTVNRKALTVTANNKTRAYDVANPALDGVLTGDVAADGITASYSTTAVQLSNVGNYPITASLNDPNTKLGNYSVTNTAGNLEITQAAASISVTGLSKVYNGLAQGATVTTTPAGLAVTVTYDGSSTVPTNYKLGGYAVVAALNNSNYTASNGTGTLVIAKAATTTLVTVPVATYTYIGSAITPATVSVTGAGGLSFAPTAVYTNNINAGTATASYTYAETANYLSSTDSKNFTIGKRPITASLTGTTSKVYDANLGAALTVSNYNLPGILGTDVIVLNNPILGAYSDKHIGNNKLVTVTGLSISGAQADNYILTLTTANANVGNITARAINVTAQAATKIYDGTTSSATTPIGDNLQGSDIYTNSGIQVYNNRNVGTSKTLTPSGTLINDGNSGNNYVITYVPNNTGVITIRPITVTAITNTKVYDGNTSAAAVPTFPALQTGDLVSTNPIEVYDNPLFGTNKTLTPSGLVINDGNSGQNYNVSYVVNTTGVITPSATTISVTISPNPVQYSDAVTFVASVSSLTAQNQLNAQKGTIEFRIKSAADVITILGTPLISDWNTLNGTVTKTYAMLYAPGTYTVIAVFTPATANFSSVTNPNAGVLNIIEEDAEVDYTGPLAVATSSASSGVALITMTATVRDITAVVGNADLLPGDIRNARVRFLIDNVPVVNATAANGAITDALGWTTVSLVNPADLKTGTVLIKRSVDIGMGDAVPYTISVEVGGTGFYIGEEDIVVTVYKPMNDFVTGGGYVRPTNSIGTYAADAGKKANFGFNIKYNKSRRSLQGNINVIFRRTEAGVVKTYQIKGNSMTSLTVTAPNTADASSTNPKSANFNGKANLTDITNPLAPISLGGNLTLQVSMTDRGEPGVNDRIAVVVYEGGGSILFATSWDGVQANELVLGGGNIVVRNSSTTTTYSSVAPTSTLSKNVTDETVVEKQTEFDVKVFGNPSTTSFKMKVTGNDTKEEISLKVADIKGNIVDVRRKLMVGQLIEFGNQYRAGTYFVEVRQGTLRKVIQLIKMN